MRRARRITWRVEPAGNGLVDVLRNGRRLRTDLLPVAAMRYIEAQAGASDRIQNVEADGYVTTVRR